MSYVPLDDVTRERKSGAFIEFALLASSCMKFPVKCMPVHKDTSLGRGFVCCCSSIWVTILTSAQRVGSTPAGWDKV